MTTALLVQPVYDEPTSIQAKFFNSILRELIRLGKAKGIRTIVLYGYDANEHEFKRAILQYDPDFIYFGGHGQKTRILGQYGDTLILFGYNEWLLKDRMVYAFECSVADIIGKASGAKAFMGYKGKFYILDDEKYIKYFMEVGFYPLLLLYEGYSFGEAYKKTKAVYKNLITRTALPDMVKELLYKNYKNFVLYGDPNARLINKKR